MKVKTVALTTVLILVHSLGSAQDRSAVQPANREAECKGHLRLIHTALKAYEGANKKLPDHLADLVPKYLTDKKLLHCPADPTQGSNNFKTGDGSLPSSYVYEMSGDLDGSGSRMLGPYPTGEKVTWRDVKTRQRRWFGDSVPVVRCGHHEGATINLTLDGNIYYSSQQWETDPSTLSEVISCLRRDLGGDAKAFHKYWLPDSVADYIRTMRNREEGIPLSIKLKIRSTAAMAAAAARTGSAEKDGDIQFMAGSLYYAAGDADRAIASFEKAALSRTDRPKEAAVSKLKELFPQTNRLDRPIRFYHELVDLYPDEPTFKRKLADWYEAAGQRAQAEEWRRKAGG